MGEKYIPEYTDLRSITRHSNCCRTIVKLKLGWNAELKWLEFGQATIDHREKAQIHILNSRLASGATDFEHSSAYAIQLPLIGLRLEELGVYHHSTHLVAWIDSERDSFSNNFRVPRPGWDPFANAVQCNDELCKDEHHLIVPEGSYSGPIFDEELFEAVKGKKVEIIISPVFGE